MDNKEQVERLKQRISRLIALNRYEAALKETLTAIALEPDNSALHQLRGICHYGMDAYDEAISAYQTCLSLTPDSARPYYLLGVVYLEKVDYEKSLSHIRKAIDIDPNEAEYFAVLGVLYQRLNDWDNALKYANKALAVNPNYVSALNLRSKVLSELGRYDESDETIRQSLSRAPEKAGTHITYGWSLIQSGKTDGALEAFQTALRIDPNDPFAKDGYVEALKTKNRVLRQMVIFDAWINSWSPVATNFYIVFCMLMLAAPEILLNRILREYANEVMAFRFMMLILLIVRYMLNPLSNFFLLFSHEGWQAMRRSQKGIGVTGIVAFVMIIAGMEMTSHSDSDGWIVLALYGMCLMYAIGAWFRYDASWQNGRIGVTILFAVCGGVALLLAMDDNKTWMFFIGVPLALIFIGLWDSGKLEPTSSKQ